MWQESEEDSSYQDNLTWNKKLFIFFYQITLVSNAVKCITHPLQKLGEIGICIY